MAAEASGGKLPGSGGSSGKKTNGGRNSGGQSGSGATGNEAGECQGGGQGGEEGERRWVCGKAWDTSHDCPELGCVSDCTSSTIVQGEPDGCGVRCPPEAPVPERECERRCDGSQQIHCGAGLYCTFENDTYASYAEPCVGSEDNFCGCREIPTSCPEPGPDEWVCARDGQAYPSLCEAHRARTEILVWSRQEECPAPRDDLYQCGGIFCRRDLDDCDIGGGLDDHDPENYHCLPLGGAGGESGTAGAAGH
jgi:hypothetical protein